ncbi:hypothetical protein F2Q69_00002530 [Brassica cretica]|uniref:Uncharacterized protein n=1 Tax=Brassica cretica TaxID=69181 RepID=A0A8S9P1Z4_BRACR|nr:hypothetical protein F2Q69_00002530 [Brassica cretica]
MSPKTRLAGKKKKEGAPEKKNDSPARKNTGATEKKKNNATVKRREVVAEKMRDTVKKKRDAAKKNSEPAEKKSETAEKKRKRECGVNEDNDEENGSNNIDSRTPEAAIENDAQRSCHRFEINPHPVAEVMSVLLKSGTSSSQEETVEDMKECQSTTKPFCQSSEIQKDWTSIFKDRFMPRSHNNLPECP